MKSNRLAAIDIGTNTIRSIVVEANPGGGFRVLDDEKYWRDLCCQQQAICQCPDDQILLLLGRKV